MKNLFGIPALAAGAVMMAAVSASAATLDFTANNDTTGTILGTVTWTVSTRAGDSLTNATHDNNVGCTGQGWNFACAPTGQRFDVGFGVNGNGTNDNEVDGKLDNANEYVEVSFTDRVQITGFAGMLTYDEVPDLEVGDRELVKLQYKNAAGSWESVLAEPLFFINNDPADGDSRFDTVGLAFRDDLALFTDTVRFRAQGRGDADDGTFNITAAGLKVAPVPLPAGGLLLLTALGGVAALRRRRKAA